MRRMLAALVVLGALAWAAPAVAATSREQLAAAVLTASDLGAGFTSVQAGPGDTPGLTSHMAVYLRAPSLANPSFMAVVDLLADVGDAGDVDDAAFAEGFAGGFAAANQTGLTLERVEAPALGSSTLKYTAAGQIAGLPVSGTMLVWRQGEVIAAVFALGSDAPDALPYALLQQDKLLAVFGA